MQRFKTRPQFQAALASGLVARSNHFAMHQTALDLRAEPSLPAVFTTACMWFGAMVPKRWAKRAVTRNIIKRQIYSLGASLEKAGTPTVTLVRLRREFSRQDFPSASSEALKAAVRAELLALMQSAKNSQLRNQLKP